MLPRRDTERYFNAKNDYDHVKTIKNPQPLEAPTRRASAVLHDIARSLGFAHLSRESKATAADIEVPAPASTFQGNAEEKAPTDDSGIVDTVVMDGAETEATEKRGCGAPLCF